MTLDEAISQACASVAVTTPKGHAIGKWHRTDTLVGKNGKGDGSVIFDEDRATAFNWQTGDKATVWLKSERTAEDRQRFAQRRADDRREEASKARATAQVATAMVKSASLASHPYLARKGFPDEQALTLPATTVRAVAADPARNKTGEYLVPEGGKVAIVVPARIGLHVSSVQLIWEDGTKKFLFGGNMSGAFQRIASGAATWLCEGYATALSIRLALHGLSRRDTVLVCFSAANVAKVSQAVRGQQYIAADHDLPPKAAPMQFGGLGTGEYFARQSGAPYTMPSAAGTDFNDMHLSEGIFAVQRHLANFIREAPT